MSNSRRARALHRLFTSAFVIPCSTFEIPILSHGSRPWSFLVIILLACGGCGGPHESSVSGTVYLNGKPLQLGDQQRGNVTFYPSAGGAAAYGQMAADGTYALSTGSEEGLKPGQYKVIVVATDNPPAAAPGQAPPAPTRFTPEKYSRLETTELVVTVDAGSNSIDLRMESP